MKSALIRYLIIVLLFAVCVAALLLYIGGDRFFIIEHANKEALRPDGGYKVSVQAAVFAAIMAIVGIIAAWGLVRFILDIPARLRSGVSKRKRGKALEAVEDAMIAAGSGDADTARKKAARASALIDRPALGSIVSAQAAEVSGDPTEAAAQYTKMLTTEKTRKVGQRGLATLAYNRGDMAAATSHAQQAYSDNDKSKWAFDILFGAQIAEADWDKALETLESGERRKHVSKDIAARRKAVILTAKAAKLDMAKDKTGARETAKIAAEGMPAFAPGVAMAARLLVQNGQDDVAAKLIEKAWSKAPHPALSMAYRDIISDEPAKARAKRIKSLTKQNPEHRESTLLTIEEALSSNDGVTAWGLLAPMVKGVDPSARLCALAAKAESLCSNPKDAALWVAKAAGAPNEPDWSDLDPEGSAFLYSDADWRRLIFSYGDTGKLIHPRHERFETARPAIDLKSIPAAPVKETPAAVPVAKPAPRTDSAPSVKSPDPEDIATPPSPDLIL